MQRGNILSVVAIVVCFSIVLLATSIVLAVDEPDSEIIISSAGTYSVSSEQGTSPDTVFAQNSRSQQAAANDALITFDDPSVGTSITNQYADLGIIFGGDSPYIEFDLSNPTSPVLSGSPTFQGEIEGYFVNPDDGTTPMFISSFSLDAGNFDELETTRIQWFDRYGNKIGEVFNSELGIQHFDINGIDIVSWSIDVVTTDPAGFAIDNVDFDPNDLLYLMEFTKVDDVNDFDCVGPGEDITYTICWEEPDYLTLEDAKIIDYLPAEVSYIGGHWSTDPNCILCWVEDTNYDPNTHSYTWDIGTLEPNDVGCVSLTVTVNGGVEPGMKIYNDAELVSGGVVHAWADEETVVCCWDTVDPNIIYVDKRAIGNDNGTSWDDAYVDLQDALYRAADSNCVDGGFTILVAQGTYSPGYDTADTYELLAGVKVFGGYRTGGGGRNPDRYETILTGVADPNSINNDAVVTMGADTLLDGFTVTESADYGIYGDGADFTVRNCIVTDNQQYGIYTLDGDITIAWCNITDSGEHGIRHEGDGFSLTVENSQVKRNKRHGIFTNGSILIVKNCIISSNGSVGQTYYGIHIENPADDPVLYNNTIVYNAIEGISFVDNGDSGGDPNGNDWPDIQNCIVYFNNDSGDQMAGMYSDDVSAYSCVQDCNELNNNINDFPGFAYTIDPNETMPYPDNYHLAYDSVCVDAGDPNLVTDPDAQDIDGEDREYGGSVDMGADEAYSCDEPLSEDDIYNALDWNADGIVNYEEFEYFSLAWLSHDPNDPAVQDPNDPVNDPDDPAYIHPDRLIDWYEWKYMCNLDDSGDSQYEIDLADLTEFIDNGYWLWIACWKQSDMDRVESMMMAMGGGESMEMTMSIPMEYSSQVAIPTEEVAIPEESLEDILGYLDVFIKEDPTNVENLYDMKDYLEELLIEIQE